MEFKRNLFQENFKWPGLKIGTELMSQIRQSAPGEHKMWKNSGCSSPIQKWADPNIQRMFNW